MKLPIPPRVLREISEDTALLWYGAALSAGHVLVCLDLLLYGAPRILARKVQPICWPMWPGCFDFGLSTESDGRYFLLFYGLLAAVVAGLWTARHSRAGWCGLALLELLRAGTVMMDFRLRKNQHYMASLVAFVFLLLPDKRRNISVLLVLFYFWAGILKMNREWLSGDALYTSVWPFSGLGLLVVCAYVVVLEVVIVCFLLAKNSWLFWLALAQVLCFHAFSWQVVGFFYPLLMLCLLCIFPLQRMFPAYPAAGTEFR